MQPFENLPRSTQIRRMRRLAQCALTAYDFEQAHITPLQHFLNTTFRIDIPSQKQRYVLRISRAGYHDAANIRSDPRRYPPVELLISQRPRASDRLRYKRLGLFRL